MFFNFFANPSADEQSSDDKTGTSSEYSSYGSYESSDDGQDGFIGHYIPRNSFKTNLLSVIFSAASHYIYGIFFNANATVNHRYEYPNIGSMCFVIATALYLIRLDLTLKRLPVESRTWKYSVYKILAVVFLTHLILEGIWQQLVNLTWELVFIGKELLEMLHHETRIAVFQHLSSAITMKTAMYFTYVEGIVILMIVLLNPNTSQD